MKKRIIVALSKYLLAFGVLGWVLYSNWQPESPTGLKAVWDKHVVRGEPIHWQYFLLGVLIHTLSVELTLMRWYLLVRAQNLPFRVVDALRLGQIGFFFNLFLPGAVGGDVIRAAFLAKEQKDRRTVAVATVIMDRVIALWGLIWFVALIGGGFWAAGMLDVSNAETNPAKMIVSIAAIVVGVTSAIWVGLGFLPSRRSDIFAGRLLRVPKVGVSLAELWRAVWMYRLKPSSIYRTMVLSWVGHVGFVTSFYCFAHTVWDATSGNPLPTLAQFFLIVPIGLVIAAAPLFPGGAGIAELGYEGLFKLFGSKPENGVMASLAKRVTDMVIGAASGVVFLLNRGGLVRIETKVDSTPNAVPTAAIMTGEARWGTVPAGQAPVA